MKTAARRQLFKIPAKINLANLLQAAVIKVDNNGLTYYITSPFNQAVAKLRKEPLSGPV
jgi:hypothetical protein